MTRQVVLRMTLVGPVDQPSYYNFDRPFETLFQCMLGSGLSQKYDVFNMRFRDSVYTQFLGFHSQSRSSGLTGSDFPLLILANRPSDTM